MAKEIFSQCRLTVGEGIESKNTKLFGVVTQIGFKITSVSPLTVESNSTSKDELLKLVDVLTSSSELQESSSNAACSQSCFLLSKCQLTVSEEIKSIDLTLFNAVTQAGFKIIRVDPLAIEKDSTSREDLAKLADLLTSDNDIQESSTNATETSADSSSSKGQEQQEDTSGSTTEKSTPADKVNIPEPDVEDYVMEKHHFHLVGEYYLDQDWKELFGKAEETDEGFRFRVKNVSAEEYGMLQSLKRIAFETIGILVGEAHRVKEAAEYINCVDHGVCVIDYNSRPYLVGPKAQVHAAKEEILYTLKEDGVDCHWTSLKTLTTQNDSDDKEKNIDNNSVDKVNAGIDRESASSSETESDVESDTVEYIMAKNDFTDAIVTGAGSSSNKGQGQKGDKSGSTTEKSNSADKVNIPEPEVEDYVMKKHHFHLVGEYYLDRGWKELFGKAEETDEGFRFRVKDVSAEEYGMLQRLKKIAFETIGISDDEAHKVKEAAEDINCVDHGVCVIDYNSRPYIVGPKAQVHAAREEILDKLKEDGVDCHLTPVKALATHDASKEKEKNTNTSNVNDKANAEKDKEFSGGLETESDTERDKTEYIMEKNDFRLAKQYFEGHPEHQYFDMAVIRGEGYLFSYSSTAADCSLFIKTLRRLNFETVSRKENDKSKVRSIADQLNCGDLEVKVIEKGPQSFLVGPKDEVARIKQKIISELYYNVGEGSDSLEDDDDILKSSKGGAKPKKFDVPKGRQDKSSYNFRFGCRDTNRSPYQVETYSGIFGRDDDPGVYTGRYNDIKVKIHKADITRLDVDCIVNATNTKLIHGGGVARAIATAAGRELIEACERFTNAGNTVEVTGVFVSPGGRLPAKHVLHAVGPKWDYYSDKKKCTDDLRRTVLRCLVEAMRLRSSSIALPSISAAISKVPKELCAHSYMEAVKSFDAIFGKDKDCTLKEIHFVDVDDIMVNHIQESFMKYWGEPCDAFVIGMDERFSQDYLSSKMGLTSTSGASLSWQRSENQGYQTQGMGGLSAPPPKPPRTGHKTIEDETEYQMRGIRLCISSKPARSFKTDPIITIGKEFDKLCGIADYKVKANCRPCRSRDYPTQKNAFRFMYLCKPDGTEQRLLCRLYPDPKSPDDIKSAVDKLVAALRISSLKGGVKTDVTSFVLTSSILYAEPNSKKKESRPVSQTLAGSLAQNVFEFLDTVSQDRNCSLRRVFITASEDALPYLYKVFDNRDVVKRVDSAARWYYGSKSGSPVDQRLVCGICTNDKQTIALTSCCSKLLCSDCCDKVTLCPYCTKQWKIRTGNQPRGYMIVSYTGESADGYKPKGSWKIEYNFPPGTQTAEHPKPGALYDGATRIAYIPATEDSMDLLKLLRLAFIRRLTFTIGTSQTTGHNEIKWNDIHHKTELHGGNYGFPDPTYFSRVIQELRDKGVTLDSMTETEIPLIRIFEKSLTSSTRSFSGYTPSLFSHV